MKGHIYMNSVLLAAAGTGFTFLMTTLGAAVVFFMKKDKSSEKIERIFLGFAAGVMIAASVLAGIIWAVIPAVTKALWNTNETLFTLMMNYVAIQLVAYFLKTFVKSGSGVLSPMPEFGLPIIGNQPYLLNIIIVAVLTVIVYIYLKYFFH